ncbi:hypothetical protein B0J13DRAFT_620533 [Dactylonectria estremocensis]|uniref:Uncharacterized protein n=1 Tax=Dactylonectria estremocensis TaxID=1079267 RepID=A0A9P9F2U1_9HYPO|nr:hypothetical protein B0J13DRAFT_620533 [Dactylonectria estremocensis]
MTLIIAAVSSDDSLKLKAESGLRTGDSQLIYVADKPSSHNSLPQNKGNEAMTYLSYMIDHYDELPEVMVFMHGHRTAWHNNALLRRSSSLTVNKLRPEAVIQSGFVNLACDKVLQRTIKPVAGALGPSVLDLTREDWEAEDGGSKLNSQSPEQLYGQYESLWRGLFPMPSDPPPPVQWSYFAGGQFALSRKQLELIPKSRLVFLRDWILQSSLSSKSAGAVFETLWEAVFFQGYFNNTATFSTSAGCYCNLYGLCPKNERLPAERIKELLDAATLMMGHLLDS